MKNKNVMIIMDRELAKTLSEFLADMIERNVDSDTPEIIVKVSDATEKINEAIRKSAII